MKRALKWAALTLLVLLIVGAGSLYGLSEYHLRKTYSIQVPDAAFRSSPEIIARGAHIATVRGCTDCHGEDLGGKLFLDQAPVGRIFAPNLTRGKGGAGSTFKSADWLRAIRHGVAPSGRPLLIMPAQDFHNLSNEDIEAVVAYIRSLPPQDRTVPAPKLGPLGRFLIVSHQAPFLPAELIDHTVPIPAAPVEARTAEYGKYLSTTCTSCHGPNFSGGPVAGMPPDFPHAQNITPDTQTGIGKWTEQDFFTALRTGKRPDGSSIREEMPWRVFGQMSDTELGALWDYLRTVPARPVGNH